MHIVRSFIRPPEALVAEISRFAPSTVHEAQGRRGAMDSGIKPIFPGMRTCGPALTVSCHIGDNLMLVPAISLARPGDVLVVAGGNNPEQGGFGEVLTVACMAKGVAGLITDCGVRDGIAIRNRGFSVFSRGLCMKGTAKETLGTINQPIDIGGVCVYPGDIVSADDDGVVVVRQDEIAEIAKRSAEREEKEAIRIKALETNMDIMELSGTANVLAAKKCVYR